MIVAVNDVTTAPPSFTAEFDHVAIAAEHQADVWPRYIGELGASWVAGGAQPGFAPAQVRFAGGMLLEVLEPHEVEHSDFLRRFLDRHGPGVHHLTFKVSDLTMALDGARALGMEPVGIDRRDPEWQEAFLHPKQAFGVVVQLAQAGRRWSSPPPAGLPVVRCDRPAALTHVALHVADLPAAIRLFQGLLGGRPTDEAATSADRRDDVLDLAWTGPGRLRLVQPVAGSEEAVRLAGLPGMEDHLALSVPDMSVVTGATSRPAGRSEVPCEVNAGVRLVLSPGA